MPLINTIHCKVLIGFMKRCKSKLDLSGKCFDVAIVDDDGDDDEVVVVMIVVLTILTYATVIYFLTEEIQCNIESHKLSHKGGNSNNLRTTTM